MKTKKVIMGLLAAVMILSMSVTYAFAVTSVSEFTDEDYLNMDSLYYYNLRDLSRNKNGSYYKEGDLTYNLQGVEWKDDAKVIYGESKMFGGIPGAKGSGIWSFSANPDTTVKDIKFPKSVVILGIQALDSRDDVTSINFEELVNLKYIGICAFNKTRITTADLSKTKVVHIDSGAFMTGTRPSLSVFKAPPTLKRIGKDAFANQTRLNHITLNEGFEVIGEGAFKDCNSFVIPSTVKEIGKNALNPNRTYRVHKDSYAEQYCKDNNYKYIYTDNTLPTNPTTPTISTIPTPTKPVNPTNPSVAKGNPADSTANPTTVISPSAKQPTTAIANPTNSKVFVNGQPVNFDAYNISNSNYFKLRDIAQAITGTEKQFNVTWNNNMGTLGYDEFGNLDGTRGGIELLSNKPYVPVGGEMTAGDGMAKTAQLYKSPMLKDGKDIKLVAYTINGNNYFRLRDLGEVFGFNVSWDEVNNAIIIDTTKGYTD